MENYKEKYECALETIQEILSSGSDSIMMSRLKLRLQSVFPELKESEDEKIRKDIIVLVKDWWDRVNKDSISTKEQMIVWLEKQGENANFQNKIQVDNQVTRNYDNVPANLSQLKQAAEYVDEVKPEFHEGDWVVFNGLTLYVKEVVKGFYRTISKGDDIANSYDWDIDNVARLWTIQDAKDGDILAGNKGDVILMFRRIGNTEWNDVIDYHCYYDCYLKDFIVQKDLQYWGDTNNNQLKPATKEQRDILFQKMKEAGYPWSAEKKELVKIDRSPKFHVGDWVVNNNSGGVYQVTEIIDDGYCLWLDTDYHLWTIQDAKDGDVLAEDTCIFIIQKLGDNSTAAKTYCTLYNDGDFDDGTILYFDIDSTKPATKEQRDLLFSKMKEAEYEFDFDNKELKKIEDEEYNGEDYGIDGLWHAQRILEKTLGDVDGYQSDDGILEHKAAITAVKKLCEQKPDWSEDDEEMIDNIIDYMKPMPIFFESTNGKSGKEYTREFVKNAIKWLKFLKDRIAWNPSEEQIHAFEQVYEWYNNNFAPSETLTSLYNDLKKL